jgi:phospholipid/cholesterol/gamma-HCH transport system substrate-binding protein
MTARATTSISATTAVVLAVATIIAVLSWHRSPQTYVLEFPTAKSLYVGNSVEVLGVKVGTVKAIDAKPDRVQVTVEVDGEQHIPADAKAAIVSPSLVPVRTISIFPAYTGGAVLPEGGVIPASRTAVPAEWDDVKTQLVRLEKAVGPQGANRNGAVGHLLDASAANLAGEGTEINRTIADMSEAMATLSDNRGDIFATVRNLQVFTSALESSDTQVDRFNRRLADVADLLADNRGDIAVVLDDLDRTFRILRTFIADNRGSTSRALDGLADTVSLLSRNRQKVADILQAAPTTLSNFYNIYDPDIPALTGSLAAANFESPAVFICSTLYSLGGTPDACQSALAPIANFFKIGQPPIGILPYVRDGTTRIDNSTLTDPADIARAKRETSAKASVEKSGPSITAAEATTKSPAAAEAPTAVPSLGSGLDLLGRLLTGDAR